MLTKDMHKDEIERALKDKGDFVQIDYLNRYINQMPATEMKKFAFLKLAEIYTRKKMFGDAAKSYKNASISSFTFKEKIENYIKEIESYIKGGDFFEAEKSFRRAVSEANIREQEEVKLRVKAIYKKEAEELEKQGKLNQASKFYEGLLKTNLPDIEKKQIKEKLISIYEKIGKYNEAKMLRGL